MQWFYDQFKDAIRQALVDVPGLDVEQFHAVLELMVGSLEAGADPHDPAGSAPLKAPLHPL